MAAFTRRRTDSANTDIWPGFVDALATLLMVIIFLLTVFVLAQFFLSDLLAGRDQALRRLETQVAELADMLALERQAGAELRASVAQLSAQLQASTSTRDRLAARVGELTSSLEEAREAAAAARSDLEAAQRQLAEREARLAEMSRRMGENSSALEKEQKLSRARASEVEKLSLTIASLRNELARLNKALEASEAKTAEQRVQIVNLGKRLNAALASKVEELSRYRSEFFGKLREVLGDRSDVRIVGDRFVFQSEVLFGSGDAQLQPAGRDQIKRLAGTLIELSKKIPKDLDWVLRVDGHTDIRPISTPEFPSNWELSTARALSVVRALVAEGVPPQRLAATGFGPYQPIAAGVGEDAFARNRRIEFKLTER